MRAWTLTTESNLSTRLLVVEATSSIICSCRIVKNKIVFCPLHESAGRLLATCDHLKEELMRPALMCEREPYG